MTRAEKIAVWNKLCQSGLTLDDVIDRNDDIVAERTRAEMRTGPFVVERLEDLGKVGK